MNYHVRAVALNTREIHLTKKKLSNVAKWIDTVDKTQGLRLHESYRVATFRTSFSQFRVFDKIFYCRD